MRKILFILAFIPLLIFGQGTQNLTVKRVKTDSLYIQKLASVSSSNIVLVLDSLTGKIGKRPYPAGGGILQDFGSNPIYFYNDGTKSIAIGNNAAIPSDGTGVSIGAGTFSNFNSVAIGYQATAQGDGSVSIGPLSGAATENEINISSGRGIELQITSDTANFQTNILKTTGGTSTDWNTAYGWGNHADAGYLANPMTATGDMVYNNVLDDGVQRLPIGSDGQVLKSITTNPGGTPITTPTWSNPDWTTSWSNIYRSVGFVGVNTTNPLSRFHTVGAVRSDTSLTPLVLGGSTVSSSLTLQSTSAAGSSDYIALKTGSGSERVRVTTDGKVGIGTTAPGYHLTMGAGLYIKSDIYYMDAGYLASSACALNYPGLSGIGNYNVTSSSALKIITKGIEAIRIDPSQRVGIGTTAPTAKVDISGNMKLGGTDTTGVGSTANVGAIHYYNGHFYGLIPGSPPQWKQLDN